MRDSSEFLDHLAKASVGQIPTPLAAVHERVARSVVTDNPDLVRQAIASGNYLPLIKAAEAMQSEWRLSRLWLAQRIGQLVREGRSGQT